MTFNNKINYLCFFPFFCCMERSSLDFHISFCVSQNENNTHLKFLSELQCVILLSTILRLNFELQFCRFLNEAAWAWRRRLALVWSFSGAFIKEISFVMFILFYIHSSNSVKQRPDLFYLQPEASCHPSSPVWYSAQPLDSTMMESMLTRILAIRDIHLDSKHQQKYLDSSDEESS